MASSTVLTAAHRGNRCTTSQETAGSIPTARNSDSPISTSTDPACRNSQMSATVTATPAVAVMPMRNGERQLKRGPRVPIGASSVLIRAATASACGDLALGGGVRLTDRLVVARRRRRLWFVCFGGHAELLAPPSGRGAANDYRPVMRHVVGNRRLGGRRNAQQVHSRPAIGQTCDGDP